MTNCGGVGGGGACPSLLSCPLPDTGTRQRTSHRCCHQADGSHRCQSRKLAGAGTSWAPWATPAPSSVYNPASCKPIHWGCCSNTRSKLRKVSCSVPRGLQRTGSLGKLGIGTGHSNSTKASNYSTNNIIKRELEQPVPDGRRLLGGSKMHNSGNWKRGLAGTETTGARTGWASSQGPREARCAPLWGRSPEGRAHFQLY